MPIYILLARKILLTKKTVKINGSIKKFILTKLLYIIENKHAITKNGWNIYEKGVLFLFRKIYCAIKPIKKA
ncbi:hypothetical protein IN54_23275 [Salmonella enterica]|nr:hypothetical protein IN54_23275 [Salmonella enterica]